MVYFGEQSLKSCSVEHKRSVRSCDCEKNEIEKNCWEVDHNFSWGQKKVNHNKKFAVVLNYLSIYYYYLFTYEAYPNSSLLRP